MPHSTRDLIDSLLVSSKVWDILRAYLSPANQSYQFDYYYILILASQGGASYTLIATNYAPQGACGTAQSNTIEHK